MAQQQWWPAYSKARDNVRTHTQTQTHTRHRKDHSKPKQKVNPTIHIYKHHTDAPSHTSTTTVLPVTTDAKHTSRNTASLGASTNNNPREKKQVDGVNLYD